MSVRVKKRRMKNEQERGLVKIHKEKEIRIERKIKNDIPFYSSLPERVELV